MFLGDCEMEQEGKRHLMVWTVGTEGEENTFVQLQVQAPKIQIQFLRNVEVGFNFPRGDAKEVLLHSLYF